MEALEKIVKEMKTLENGFSRPMCEQLMELCFFVLLSLYRKNQIKSIQINPALLSNNDMEDEGSVVCKWE